MATGGGGGRGGGGGGMVGGLRVDGRSNTLTYNGLTQTF